MAKTILVVDDEELIRRVVSRVLTKNGFNVVEASLPTEALDLCQSDRDHFDLIISDVVMPGINGPDMVRRLSGRCAQIPVIFMSAYMEEQYLDELPPNTPLFVKPFPPVYLLYKVREMLDSQTEPS